MRRDQKLEPISLLEGKVTGKCFVTGEEYSIIVPLDGLRKWEAGDYIQTALPGLSPDEREFLISGTSPEGWKKLFPHGDEGE